MKKTLLALVVFFSTPVLFAAYPNGSLPVNDSTVQVLLKNATNNHDQQLLLYCLMNKYSVKQYQKLLGKKLSFKQRIDYFLIKHKLEKSDNNAGVSIGGFFLGFLLGPFGVLIAYLVKKNKNLRKWTWIGWGTSLVLGLIVAIVVISSIGRWN